MYGAQIAPTLQLPAGVIGRIRSMCGHSRYADRTAVRGARKMELRRGILRHLGVVRCLVLHRIHFEFVRDLGGPILGHHKASRIRCETNATPYDVVRSLSMARGRMHITATIAHSWKRTL